MNYINITYDTAKNLMINTATDEPITDDEWLMIYEYMAEEDERREMEDEDGE